jgi:hypothetical protein
MHRYKIRLKSEKGNGEFEDNYNNIKMYLKEIQWEDWLRIGTSGGIWERCYEPSSSTDGRELLD